MNGLLQDKEQIPTKPFTKCKKCAILTLFQRRTPQKYIKKREEQ